MPTIPFLLLIIMGVLPPRSAQLPNAQKQTGPASPTISGRWIVRADFYGTPLVFSLELKREGDKLTGDFDGNKLEGSLQGNSIHFLPKESEAVQRSSVGPYKATTFPAPRCFLAPTIPSLQAAFSSRPRLFPSAVPDHRSGTSSRL